MYLFNILHILYWQKYMNVIVHERKIKIPSFRVWEYQGDIGLPCIKKKYFTRIFTYTVKNPNYNDNSFTPFV